MMGNALDDQNRSLKEFQKTRKAEEERERIEREEAKRTLHGYVLRGDMMISNKKDFMITYLIERLEHLLKSLQPFLTEEMWLLTQGMDDDEPLELRVGSEKLRLTLGQWRLLFIHGFSKAPEESVGITIEAKI